MYGDSQLVLVDLPGVQRPRDALTERMANRVGHELDAADAALLVLNGEQGVGPGDRFIAANLAPAAASVTVAVNKIDRLGKAGTASALAAAAELGVDGEIFPIAARVGPVRRRSFVHLARLLPEAPLMFAPDQRSDQPRELLLAALVREAVVRRTFHELPHAVDVVVEEVERPRAGAGARAGSDLGGERVLRRGSSSARRDA